jgi:hypothetical protein
MLDGVLVAHCSRAAATAAVERWHYSRKMPSGKLVTHGVWEDVGGQLSFIGAIVYGRGANLNMAGQYGLRTTEVAELVRVALTAHRAPVTQLVAESLRLLRRLNPGLRLVVSYADPAQGHLGVIYQAGSWTYTGTSTPQAAIRLQGEVLHKRSVSARYGTASVDWLREHVDPAAAWVPTEPKHQYLMPLDRAMRRRVQRRAVPFPRG